MKLTKILSLFILVFVSCFSCFGNDGKNDGDWWYKTQMGTGPGNCGPASAAMAVQWATGKNISVQKARNVIGWPVSNGAIGIRHITKILNYFKASFKQVEINTIKDIDKYLAEGNIIIVLFNTKTISKTDGSKYGRTYNEAVGHYIVMYKSYRDFWVVNDPMYDGNGRLYLKEEVFKSLYREIIIVWRNYNK
jgi:ABC-type bacteriocin/lantibiotic exporter with double-glycine peptidase domain